MRTLVHLSDLHFGRVEPALLDPLAATVRALAPDVVVVSGDLTQRARTAQFVEARAFLARLPGPQVIVPGNHDVPLHNLAARLLTPLAKFRRYIEPSLNPCFIDDEIAVVGVNTARALVVKGGRVGAAQLEALRGTFDALDEPVVKVVVTHHPFDVPAPLGGGARVGRADRALAAFARSGVDVLLAGHLHTSHRGGFGADAADADADADADAAGRPGRGALVVSAGTATSTRGRGEANSFNVLRLETGRIAVERFDWSDAERAFGAAALEVFVRTAAGWTREDAAATPR